MGLYAFRRLREREATAAAVASLSSDESKIESKPKAARDENQWR